MRSLINDEMAKEPRSNIYKIAFLVSLSCVLQACESLIPHPVPGLRLGLANVITLIVLVNLGFKHALEVAVLRTLLSSFVMGSFMSPGFILSFSAAVVSTLAMGFFYRLACFYKHLRVSIIGISILGALIHNLTQLYLAYFLLIKHPGIFVFLPWLCIGAIAMGWLTGICAAKVCLKLEQAQAQPADRARLDYAGIALGQYCPGNSFVHRLPAQIKIAVIFLFSLIALVSNNLWFYAGLFLFLALTAIISAVSFSSIILKLRRYAFLLFASFLLPACFNSGKHILSQIGYVKITSEGLNAGIIFTLRAFLLIMMSSLLSRTTSPKELAGGLSRILAPFGFYGRRAADIISVSWTAVPVFWEMAKNSAGALGVRRLKDPRNFVPFLSEFIAALYLETDRIPAED